MHFFRRTCPFPRPRSYNRVNGEHACGSRQLLADLRDGMGFAGWVVSDWWAIHSSSAAANGVDQEMPGRRSEKDPRVIFSFAPF